MSSDFNIVGLLSLRLNQSAARTVQAEAQRAVGGIRGKVDLDFGNRTLSQLKELSTSMRSLQAETKALAGVGAAAAASVGKVGTAMSGVASRTTAAAEGMRAGADATRKAGSAAQAAGQSFSTFGERVASASARFASFQVGAGVVSAVSGAFRSGVAGAINFDLQLNRLRQTSGDTVSDVAAIGRTVTNLSKSLGVSSDELASVAVTLKQAGLSSQETRVGLEAVAKASLGPSFKDAAQVAEGSIAIWSQYGRQIGQLEQRLGAVNAVASATATESSDLITAIQRTGGAAVAAGASFDEFLSIFSSVRSTTRESAESISTALRTIFARIQRGDTVDSLKALGIELRHTAASAAVLGDSSLEGQFVGANSAVQRLSEGLGKLRTSDPRFAGAVEALGGYMQVSKVIPLLQQQGELQRALNAAKLGSASLDAAVATRQDAIANKVSKVKEEFQALFNETAQTRSFKTLADSLIGVADGFVTVLGAAKPLLPVLTALAAVKVAQGTAQFTSGVFKTFTAPGPTAVSQGSGFAGRRRFARGGVVPGSGIGDVVPSVLESGEYVIKKDSARKIGYDALHAINSGRNPDRFKFGGAVRPRKSLFDRLRSRGVEAAATLALMGGNYAQSGNIAGDDDALEVAQRRQVESRSEQAKRLGLRGRRGYAEGGLVRALLEPGEFLLGRETAARLGPDALRRMNLHGDVPRFARGGPVPRYAGGTGRGGVPDLNAEIMEAISKVRFNSEDARQDAVIRLLTQGGDLPTDPGVRGAYLVKEAWRASDATQMAEKRQRARLQTGALDGVGNDLVDSLADHRDGDARGPSASSPEAFELAREKLAKAGGRLDKVGKKARAEIRAAAPVVTAPEPEVFAPAIAAQVAAPQTVLRNSAARGSSTALVPVGSTALARPDAGPAASRAVSAALARTRSTSMTAAGGRTSGADITDADWRIVPPRLELPPPQAMTGRDPRQKALPPSADPFSYSVVPDGASPVLGASGVTSGYAVNPPRQRRGPKSQLVGGYDFKDEFDPASLNPYAPLPGPTGVRSGSYGLAKRNRATPPDDGWSTSGSMAGAYGLVPDEDAGRAGVRNRFDAQAALDGTADGGSAKARAAAQSVLAGARGAADIAGMRGDAAIDAKGGSAVLSNASVVAARQAAADKVQRELTAAVERQLRSVNSAITSTEALAKAQEMAADALKNNEAVLRNDKGEVTGTAALGQQLADRGLDPTGATGRRSIRSRAGGAARAFGRSFTPTGNNIGTFAAITAAPMVASQFEPNEDDYKLAASTGDTAGVRTSAGLTGAASMAAVGAGVGLMFGPLGAAVGGVTGGLFGLTKGLLDAGKEIREAKVGAALSKLGEMLASAANSISVGPGATNQTDLRKELATVQSEVDNQVYDQTTRNYLNPRRMFDRTGMSDDQIADVRKKATRSNFGGQAGGMVTLLSRQAEELGKQNPNAKASQLGGRLAADPVSGQLLTKLAAVQGVPVGRVVKDFTDSIAAAQRSTRVSNEVNRGRDAADRSAVALSRLADAATNAAASTAGFDAKLELLSGVFSGQAGGGKVASVSAGFATLGQGQGGEFRRSAAVVGSAVGPAGDGFLRTAAASDQLARVLPGVLASLADAEIDPQVGVGSKARDLLGANLLPGLNADQRTAALKANPELAGAIEAVVGGLSKIDADAADDGGLGAKLRQDPGKVADTVIQEASGKLKEYFERIGKALEEAANKFVDGLAQARQMASAVGESRDRLGDATLVRRRVEAEVGADRTGKRATDLLSLKELQAPFQAKQERLTGFAGEAATDPAAIARRLVQVTSQMDGAVVDRNNALGSKDKFAAAAGNMDRLAGQANNLTTALRNLADVSNRAAVLQEKLSAATANRDGRLSYAERFVMASGDQRGRMRQGQRLVTGIDRGKVEFKKLSDDDQRLATETMNDLGAIKLASGRTGEGLKRDVYGAMNGAVDPKQEAERRGLQDQLVGVYKSGEAAQSALITFQEGVYAKFLTDLQGLHAKFFASLASSLAAERVNGLRNSQTAAVAEKKSLTDQVKQREVLARLGVKDDSGVKNLRAVAPSVSAYLEFADKKKALKGAKPLGREAEADIAKGIADFDFAANSKDIFDPAVAPAAVRKQLAGMLGPNGLEQFDDPTQQRVADDIRASYVKRTKGMAPDATNAQKASVLQDVARQELTAARNTEIRKLDRDQEESKKALVGRGVNTAALDALDGGSRGVLTSALKGTEQNFSTLDQRIREADASLARFRDQLAAAEAALRTTTAAEQKVGQPAGVVPKRLAGGGSAPSGTDTVAAWLTPSEFVVNRASAMANLPLLKAINAARGAVYLAGGGRVDRSRARRETDADALMRTNPYGPVAAAFAAETGRRLGVDEDRVSRGLLGMNRRMNAESMAYEQLIARGGTGRPGEEGQAEAAAAAVGRQREGSNAYFQGQYGGETRLDRARATSGYRSVASADARKTYESFAVAELRRKKASEMARRVRPRGGESVVRAFASGGLVPGSGSGDSVMALLTPQEYVLNKTSVKALGVNYLDGIQRFAAGGLVGGGSGGGSGGGGGPLGMPYMPPELKEAMTEFGAGVKAFVPAATAFSAAAASFVQGVSSFGSHVDKFVTAIEQMPTEMTHQFRGDLNVNVNGTEAMNDLKGDLQKSVAGGIMNTVVDYIGVRFPDSGPGPLRSDPSRYTR